MSTTSAAPAGARGHRRRGWRGCRRACSAPGTPVPRARRRGHAGATRGSHRPRAGLAERGGAEAGGAWRDPSWLRSGSYGLPRYAPAVAVRGDDRGEQPRAVLHQRQRHRPGGRVLGGRHRHPGVEPDRHPERQGGRPPGRGRRFADPARTAPRPHRPDRHGQRDVEDLRRHRRLPGAVRQGDRGRVRVGVASPTARPVAGDDRVHQGLRRLSDRAAPEPRRQAALAP